MLLIFIYWAVLVANSWGQIWEYDEDCLVVGERVKIDVSRVNYLNFDFKLKNSV